jgi:hypothetical protein
MANLQLDYFFKVSYLFANILFKFYSIGSEFTIYYSFNVEKFIKNEALFVQSLNKYFQ